MRSSPRCRSAWIACLTVFLLPCPLAADEDRAATRTLDETINQVLRDVINEGADRFNMGDPAACYHLFLGSLKTLRPLLQDHPDLQERIDKGLADAARQADMRRRAYALRDVLSELRAELGKKKEQ